MDGRLNGQVGAAAFAEEAINLLRKTKAASKLSIGRRVFFPSLNIDSRTETVPLSSHISILKNDCSLRLTLFKLL